MNYLRTHPVLILLIPLIAVILLSRYTHWPVDLLRDTEVSYLNSPHYFKAVVTDYPIERNRTWRYTCKIWDYDRPSTVYLYLQPDSTRELPSRQDTILVKTTIFRGDSLGKFDYGTYLRLQGIAGTGYVPREAWRLVGKGHSKGPKEWQHQLILRYQSLGIDASNLSLLTALTLGYKEDLDDHLQQTFQRAGAAHILAVSGLHTGLLAAILLTILTGFGRWRPLYVERKKRCLLSLTLISLLWGYAALTGWSPSVLRSVTMITLAQLAYMVYRPIISVHNIYLAAFFLLCFLPRDLFSVGFQLSFSAVLSIVLFQQGIQQILPHIEVTWHPAKVLVQHIWALISVSIAAQIGTIPLTWHYFSQNSNYFLLTNLGVIDLSFLIILSALLLLCLGGIPYIGIVLAWICNQLLHLLSIFVQWVEQLPKSVSYISISTPQVWYLYGAIISAYLAFHRNNYGWFILTGCCLSLFILHPILWL